MPEAIEFLTNPEFHKLPLGDRLEVLRKDPNFSSLNSKDQGEIVSRAQQKLAGGQPVVNKPEDAGFFSTLGHDVANIPSGMIQAVSHPLDTYRADKGARDSLHAQAQQDFQKGQYSSAFGHNLASYIPFIGPQASQAGEELGSGQTGQGAAHATEALLPFMGRSIPGVSKLGQAAKAGVSAGGKDLALGGLKTATGVGVGAAGKAVGAPGLVDYLLGADLARPGLRQMGQGLAKGARAAVDDFKGKTTESIGEVTSPGKGPSIGQLKTAAKSGTITPEQFDAHVDKMTDLAPETKELHKSDLRTSLAPKSDIKFPVNSPKTLSLGDLKSLVKVGRLTTEEFTDRLSKLGYNEEDSAHLTELLKKQIEDEGEIENKEPKPSKNPGKVESPVKKKNPELNSSP